MSLNMKSTIDRFVTKNIPDCPLAGDQQAGRVVEVQKGHYSVCFGESIALCTLSGTFLFGCKSARQLPTVGDYVIARRLGTSGSIVSLLHRSTLLSRIAPGSAGQEQLLAANIDKVVIATAFGRDFNLRRIERYLLIAWESGALPVVALTKADLCDDISEALRKVTTIAGGAPIFPVSTKDPKSIEELAAALAESTVVIVGSSGVGKSTLINQLVHGAGQSTHDVREGDDKGRHTTTARSMLQGPNGLFIIDTPGMREVQIHGESEAIDQAFEDVTSLLGRCKFTNCRHNEEPGCRVKEAIEVGQLSEERVRSFEKLERERLYAMRRGDKVLAAQEKLQWKRRSKEARQRRKIEGW